MRTYRNKSLYYKLNKIKEDRKIKKLIVVVMILTIVLINLGI